MKRRDSIFLHNRICFFRGDAMNAQKNRIMKETAILSLCSVSLQGLGLLFNIFLTKRLGAPAIGMMTLAGSFYGLAAVLSGGSGFVAASRFLSEELGCKRNPGQIFRYAVRFCTLLSCSAAVILFLFAPQTAELAMKTTGAVPAIRILSLTLPLSAISACLKGRCYAYHRIYIPVFAECVEFMVKSSAQAICTLWLIPSNKITVLTSFAVSIAAGQGSSLFFLLMMRFKTQENLSGCTISFRQFIRKLLPIMGNACLVAILGSANDALVPLCLLQYGNSTEEALAQFGSFEAIILPTLFFPSVIQCCMSGLLVPVLSREKAAGHVDEIRMMTERVLEQTVSYAFCIVLILVQFGNEIGCLLGGDTFTGAVLCRMAPVVPLIYLEIILEGILRGLGKQNFSSLNYLAEYIVRISVLLICVPLFGFYGIAASYMACNLTGNAVRLSFVLRTTGLKPVVKRIFLRPLFTMLFSWQFTQLLMTLSRNLSIPAPARTCSFLAITISMYMALLYLLNHTPKKRRLQSAA